MILVFKQEPSITNTEEDEQEDEEEPVNKALVFVLSSRHNNEYCQKQQMRMSFNNVCIVNCNISIAIRLRPRL